jgi:type I restriction enzyme S subunit
VIYPIVPIEKLCRAVNVGHVGPSSMHRDPDGVPFIMGRNVGFGFISTHNIDRVTEKFHRSQPKSQIRAGDVVVVRIGKSGQAAKVPESLGEANCSGLIIIKQPEKINADFLVYFLNSPIGRMNSISLTRGSTRLTLNTKSVASTMVPVPPLCEQRRIVGILDEAFGAIATAKAKAETNLQNARAPFESYLEAIFSRRGEGWNKLTLEALLEKKWIISHLDGNHGGEYPRKEEFIDEGVPYISANCLEDGKVDLSRAKHLSQTRAARIRKGVARDNDVLFAHNATVGPVAVLRTEEEKIILGTSLTYYRCDPERILPDYLAHYMRSSGFKKQYLSVMRQSTRNQVPITKQREFYHVIPPLDEQRIIIKQLDGLLENGKQLESVYRQKLTLLEELRKSLLHRAFTGAL